MMIKEALQFLHDKFQPRSVDLREMKDAAGQRDTRRYLLVDGSSASVKEFPTRAARDHTVSTIDDLCELVNRYAMSDATIWVTPTRVLAILDNRWAAGTIKSDPSDQVVLKLEASAFYRGLESCGLTAARKHGQREFLQLLRRGLGPENAESYAELGLIGKAQNLRFLASVEGSSTVVKGRDTMSQTVDKQLVSRDGELPDAFEATGPLYRNPDLADLSEIMAEIALDSDPEEKKFVTEVDAIKFERAQNDVLKAIVSKVAAGLLAEKHVGIFLGNP